MDNSLALFFSVLFICISIFTVKSEVWGLQEQQEQLKKEIEQIKQTNIICEVTENDN